MPRPIRTISMLAWLAAVSPALAQQQPPGSPPPPPPASTPAPTAGEGGGRGLFAACKADLSSLCKDSGGLGARIQCLKANQDKLSPECIGTIRAILGTVQQKAAAVAAMPNAPRPLKACQQDLASLCPDLGKNEGGRIACLRGQKAKLSPGCAEAIDAARTQAKEVRKVCEADGARLCSAAGEKAADQMRCLRQRQAELTGECKQLVTTARAAKVKAAARQDAYVPPPPATPPQSLPSAAVAPKN